MSWNIACSRLEKNLIKFQWKYSQVNVRVWENSQCAANYAQVNFKKRLVNSWIFHPPFGPYFQSHLMIIPSWTGTWLIQCCVLEKPIETPVRAIRGVRHHNMSRFIVIWLFGLSPIGWDEFSHLACPFLYNNFKHRGNQILHLCTVGVWSIIKKSKCQILWKI